MLKVNCIIIYTTHKVLKLLKVTSITLEIIFSNGFSGSIIGLFKNNNNNNNNFFRTFNDD